MEVKDQKRNGTSHQEKKNLDIFTAILIDAFLFGLSSNITRADNGCIV